MNKEEHSELYQFFAGYFHEDWSSEAATPDDVIDSFNDTHTDADRRRIASSIRSLLIEQSSETILTHMLNDEFGCYYLPSADAKSVGEWLKHVADRLHPNT